MHFGWTKAKSSWALEGKTEQPASHWATQRSHGIGDCSVWPLNSGAGAARYQFRQVHAGFVRRGQSRGLDGYKHEERLEADFCLGELSRSDPLKASQLEHLAGPANLLSFSLVELTRSNSHDVGLKLPKARCDNSATLSQKGCCVSAWDLRAFPRLLDFEQEDQFPQDR
jgi:hypothetical protein